MTIVTHQDVFNKLEEWAPKQLAYDWDPIGLQVGNVADNTSKILISLDVTDAVVDEAISKSCNLIIAHHPLLFKPLTSVNTSTQKGSIVQKLIKHDITVYASHTNLDIASGGVNDILAHKLNVLDVQPLVQTASENLFKLVIHVPKSHTRKVREALGTAGAGFIGDYSHCTFQTEGVGTFKPLDGTNPFIGEKGKMAFVEEDKLETIIKEADISSILKTLNEAHPYEEVAYDLYPVKQTGQTFGLGRIGKLAEAATLGDLCESVKDAFDMSHLRFTGNKDRLIKRVAIIGGSGEKYAQAALKKGADVLITGDVNFHPAQDAIEMGLPIIDPGHYIEKAMKEAVKNYLNKQFLEIENVVSKVNTDPFHFM